MGAVRLDVNNVYVSAHNHGFDAKAFIDTLPLGRVRQLHLASHSQESHGGRSWLIDTHDQPVCEGVWALYRHTLRRFGPLPTMIERDDHIPPLPELLAELAAARTHAALPPLLRALPGNPESPRISLGIYRNAWRGRLIAALRSSHPVLHRVLGDDDFAELATGFMTTHPPHTPSIRWFGAAPPAYLQQQPGALPHPALADLARMEWALGLSFDAADAAPLDGTQLAALAPEDWAGLQLAAHPSLQLLHLEWAIEPLWQQLTHAPGDAQTTPPEPLAHQLLVWRQDLDSRWRSLQPEEAALLQATLAGAPFGELGHVAVQQVSEEAAPGLLASALQTWVNQGLLVRHTG